MAAVVQIVEKNGAGGTATDKTSDIVRFKLADNATVDTVNPLVKPGAGTEYSYEKWLRFKVDSGTYTQIDNIKVYSDGSNDMGTGVSVYAKAVTTYATPAEASSTSGYTDFFTYTSGSPLDLGGDSSTGAGEKGDHCVMIMTLSTSVSGGITASETMTWVWDEV
jgi:hypothetical protein